MMSNRRIRSVGFPRVLEISLEENIGFHNQGYAGLLSRTYIVIESESTASSLAR